MPLTDTEYLDWIYDPTRNQARVFLVELDHSAGTLYFASSPWMDPANSYQPYDDWIKGKPQVEDSLDNFLGVGDIDIVNMDSTLDWLSLNFRGYESRWYYGDVAWPKADFRQIANSMIGGCRLLTEKLFRFDLLDNGQIMNRPIDPSTIPMVNPKSGLLKDVIDDIMSDAGLPAVTYINIDNAGRNMNVSINLSDSDRVDTVVKKLAASVGAFVRITQTGDIEVYRPNTLIQPDIQLNDDNIGFNGLQMIEVTPAYQNVTIVRFDGTEHSGTTTAPTGSLDESITIQTQLNSSADATTILAEKVNYHDEVHSVWQAAVLDVGGMIQVGDRIGIDHQSLFANATVERISRSPLSPPFTYVDLIV